MPITTQSITISGVGPVQAVPYVLVTYDCNQLGEQLPWPNTGNMNQTPGFMYLMGNVTYSKDSQGNVLAQNAKQPGST